MSRRLVALVLLAAVSQLNTGCFHIARCAVARFRANHPCLTCSPAFRVPPAVGHHAPPVGEPAAVGPVFGGPAPGPGCVGCNGGLPADALPVTYPGPGGFHGPVSFSGGPPPGFAPGGGPADGYPVITGPTQMLHNPRVDPPAGAGAGGVPGPMPAAKNGGN